MIRMIAGFVGVFLIALTLTVSAEDSKDNTAAIAAAETWLALVDKGNYGESWQEAAAYFKNAISREQWGQSLTSAALSAWPIRPGP